MSGDIVPIKQGWGPRAATFSTLEAGHYSMTMKTAHANFAEFKMNGIPLLDRANLFEAGLFSWGIPEQTARELTRHHTELSYTSGKLILARARRPTS